MNVSRVVPILAVAALPGLVACGGKEEPPPPAAQAVRVVTVGEGGGSALTFPGTVEAADRAVLSFQVPGSVAEIPVKEGDRVQKGQLVAQLDPTDYEIATREAQAAFDQAEAEAKRYQRLYEQNAVPIADVELRRSQRDVAQAKLEQAKTNLGYARITAPFDGVVGKRHVEKFEQVQAKQAIVSLNGTGLREVAVDFPEQYIARARGGVSATAAFDALPGRELPLTVEEIATQADPATRTYRVTFTFANLDDANILPGMTAKVTVTAAAGVTAGAGLVVPVRAVTGAADSAYVWVLDRAAGAVHRRGVTAGDLVGEDGIRVLQGLTAGEEIAVTGVQHLQEGMAVRPTSN